MPLERTRRRVRVVETSKIYRNQSVCAEALGISQPLVSNVLASGGKRTAKGFHLEYVD
jgi:hypothetical protein